MLSDVDLLHSPCLSCLAVCDRNECVVLLVSSDSKRLLIILIRRCERCTGFGLSFPSVLRMPASCLRTSSTVIRTYNFAYLSFSKVQGLCMFTVVLFVVLSIEQYVMTFAHLC